MLTEERVICELRRLGMQPGSDMHADAEVRARQERVSEFQCLLERNHAQARALRNEAAAKVAVLRTQGIQLEGRHARPSSSAQHW